MTDLTLFYLLQFLVFPYVEINNTSLWYLFFWWGGAWLFLHPPKVAPINPPLSKGQGHQSAVQLTDSTAGALRLSCNPIHVRIDRGGDRARQSRYGGPRQDALSAARPRSPPLDRAVRLGVVNPLRQPRGGHCLWTDIGEELWEVGDVQRWRQMARVAAENVSCCTVN